MDVAPLSVKSVLASYTLSLAVFIPISGWMADRFGTRRVFASAIGVFTLGSLLCGLSTNTRDAGGLPRPAGLGGAMMVPVGRMTLARTYDKSDLVRVMSFVAIPGLVGPMVGPVAGGLIVAYFDWRRVLRQRSGRPARHVFRVSPPAGLSRDADHPLDFVGLVLFGGGIALLSYVLEVFGEHP